MSDNKTIKEEKKPQDTTDKPLPAVDGEQVTDGELDDVAGGLAKAWCTLSCGVVTA
jgi:hypothetical protein